MDAQGRPREPLRWCLQPAWPGLEEELSSVNTGQWTAIVLEVTWRRLAGWSLPPRTSFEVWHPLAKYLSNKNSPRADLISLPTLQALSPDPWTDVPS